MTVYRPECWICIHAVIKEGDFKGCSNKTCNLEFRDGKKQDGPAGEKDGM